tara:strand:- start:222 stop:464 length:243 start_codon:yes stop_codon:yes gene_type:complete
MIEKLIPRHRRIEIRDYARERWNVRDTKDARTAALVQEDTFRFIRKKKVTGLWSALLTAVAIKFAARLINNWLEELIDER